MRFTIVLLPKEEGGYTALVPALGSIASQGETVAEALTNVREAITGYLEATTPGRRSWSAPTASRTAPWSRGSRCPRWPGRGGRP